MKYMDEYRDAGAARQLAAAIHATTTRAWSIMEVCGGQTHAIVKFGIDELLPPGMTLLHGPGCPVCVTPLELIEKAIRLTQMPKLVLCSFGDMLRVPGSESDLLNEKSKGHDVRIVYSPMDALDIARRHPDREIVFFAVGFETTAPANAMAVYQAHQEGLKNFSILVSHVLVPPAIEAVLSDPQCLVNGFLAAGHVCTVMGYEEYIPIARRYQVPIVVTGFEPVDILQGILMCVTQLESGSCSVENQYVRAVRREGNGPACHIVDQVFETSDRAWRGMGEIPDSGLRLRSAYHDFDAEKRFTLEDMHLQEPEVCISGQILQGLKKPVECPAFGRECTPEHPLGATMVSNEGACSAYYQYRGAGA